MTNYINASGIRMAILLRNMLSYPIIRNFIVFLVSSKDFINHLGYKIQESDSTQGAATRSKRSNLMIYFTKTFSGRAIMRHCQSIALGNLLLAYNLW